MALLDPVDGDLITYWKTQGSITSLVGTGDSAQIYVEQAKQGISGEHIVFIEQRGTSHRALNGPSALRTAIVDVYAIADTMQNARALAEAVRIATEGHRGLMGTVYVHDTLASAPESGLDRAEDGSYNGRYYVLIEYTIVHAITAA